MKIKKPLLAAKYEPNKAKFPYILTPKIDGIRFLKVDGKILSRSFKPIRNKYIQSLLSTHLPEGVDGELTCGDTFQSSTSGIMSIEGEPNFKVWIFDYVDPSLHRILPFQERINSLILETIPQGHFDFDILRGALVYSEQELFAYEQFYLNEGFEGVMLRDPNGTYKFGRGTVNENILLKVKRFLDDEGEIIGFEEKMHNENELEVNELGYAKRSSSKAGMVPADTLGSLVLKNSAGDVVHVGSGLDDALRKEIWQNQDEYLGLMVKYKYFQVGVKDLPRHPTFLGFRDKDDL